MGEFKLIKAKKRCCKSRPRCKKCPVVCKRLADQGLAVRQSKRHYLVELDIGKKTLKAARAR
jgi:aldehyde:ferredoxin oxidoreductase